MQIQLSIYCLHPTHGFLQYNQRNYSLIIHNNEQGIESQPARSLTAALNGSLLGYMRLRIHLQEHAHKATTYCI